MTNEQIAKWGGRIFILLLAVTIVGLVYGPDLLSKPGRHDKATTREKQASKGGKSTTAVQADSNVPEVVHLKDTGNGEITTILDEAARKRGGLVVGIVHYHAPGNSDSENTADSLNQVSRKYGSQVRVFRADIVASPELAQAEKITNPPKVVMIIDKKRAFEFQGLWSRQQIERKVDELIHGLERIDKNWRPEVKGMSRNSSNSSPLPQNSVKP